VYVARKPYEWSGTVEARAISLGSRAGGRVKEVLVHEGDRVAPGQPILTFEPADWPAQLVQAEARVTQLEANLDKLQRGARPEEIAQAKARALTAQAALSQALAGSRPEQIKAAEARLAAQELAVERARLEDERTKSLDRAGATTPVEVDNSSLALKKASAERDALKEQLSELQNGARREEIIQARARSSEQTASEHLVSAGARSEDIKAAEAEVLGARGKVDQVKSMLSELTVRAPVAASVEALDLRPGDIVAPNATATVLLENDQLYVRIYVPETELGRMHLGQSVPVIVDSFPDESFGGVVEHINGVGEFSPRNLQTADERADQVFAARVGLRSGLTRLRAGMAALIRVPK
jgi:multidrug resistance efflux pump